MQRLVELDSGLRSNKIGEQCEAIVLLGRLLKEIPDAVVINTALLKLADLFRNR
jgi:integrator complex subunit 7